MEFERRFEDGPACAEAVSQSCRIGVARHAGGHALPALEDLLGAGEAVLCQEDGGQPVRGGLCGVKLLGIGGVAQELPKPGGLRAGGTDRVKHRRRVEAEKAAGRYRCRDRARGSGRMEDLVMRTAQEFADADADLIAGD